MYLPLCDGQIKVRRKLTDSDHMAPERGSALQWGHAAKGNNHADSTRKEAQDTLRAFVRDVISSRKNWMGAVKQLI